MEQETAKFAGGKRKRKGDEMSDKTNAEVRQALRDKGLRQWQLAERLGVSENTLCRQLRKELPAEQKARILKAISK